VVEKEGMRRREIGERKRKKIIIDFKLW